MSLVMGLPSGARTVALICPSGVTFQAMVPFSVSSVMVVSALAASAGSIAGLRQPVTATEDARETAPTMNGVIWLRMEASSG